MRASALTRRELVLAAAVAGLAARPAPAQPAVVTVRIHGHRFDPPRLTVPAGTTVRWVNDERRTSHSVRFAAEGGLESERLLPGEHWERRFERPGRHPYDCGPHPEMTGVIEVVAAEAVARWRGELLAGELRLVDAASGVVGRRWALPGGGELLEAPVRRSLVVAPAALPELWEISLDPHAEDQYEGLVHDFRMGEGVPVRGYLHARRTRLPHALGHVTLDAAGVLLVGAAAGQPLRGVNLDARRLAAQWEVGGGDPRPRAGAWCAWRGRPGLAMPDAERARLLWLDAEGTRVHSVAMPVPLQGLRLEAPGRLVGRSAQAAWRIDLDTGDVTPLA